LACALVSVVTTLGIVVVLVRQSWSLFSHISPFEFYLGTRWAPLLEPRSFGVLPLVCGTFEVTAGAVIIAVPIGIATAIYLSEYASVFVRQALKPILEILAGIPTVVYGYFAVVFVTPHLLKPLVASTQTFNAASAAIVVAIMIIPTICSLSDDAFASVPRSLREAGYALSATPLEVSTRIVLPAAMSGVVAAVLLALARAIGETMAVSLAAGLTPKMTLNPFVSIQTMTSFIVQVSQGDTAAGSIEYQTIFGVALTLFIITLATNMIAQIFTRRFREVYE